MKSSRSDRLLRSLLRMAMLFTGLLGLAACVLRQPTWKKNSPSPKSVDAAKLATHVHYLTVDCHPRHYLARENQAKALQYMETQFRLAGGRVERQTFNTPSGPYQNVLARFGPESKSRIIVGAHFDTCGIQPGADDNASGVAGLLELAHLLGGTPTLSTTVELVAYNLEEPPFFAGPYMGSAVHARMLREEGVEVRLMLSLEMIGYYSDEWGSQEYPAPLLGLLYPNRGNFIAIVGRWSEREVVARWKRACMGAADLKVVSIAAPSFVPAVDFSDHRNYWEQGYPALMITDTAFLRNPNYHQETDTASTLNYLRMAEVVRLVHAGIASMSEAAR